MTTERFVNVIFKENSALISETIIEKVIPAQQITLLPNSNPKIIGLINYRSQITPVLSLDLFLTPNLKIEFNRNLDINDYKIIILNVSKVKIAFLINSILTVEKKI